MCVLVLLAIYRHTLKTCLRSADIWNKSSCCTGFARKGSRSHFIRHWKQKPKTIKIFENEIKIQIRIKWRKGKTEMYWLLFRILFSFLSKTRKSNFVPIRRTIYIIRISKPGMVTRASLSACARKRVFGWTTHCIIGKPAVRKASGWHLPVVSRRKAHTHSIWPLDGRPHLARIIENSFRARF